MIAVRAIARQMTRMIIRIRCLNVLNATTQETGMINLNRVNNCKKSGFSLTNAGLDQLPKARLLNCKWYAK